MSKSAVLAVALALGACQVQESGPATGRQAIKGGDGFTGDFESVCAIYIQPPNDADGNPQDPFYCTGVKIAASMVLTSASCVADNIEADTLSDVDIRFGTDFASGTAYTADQAVLHRYYDPDQSAYDLALLHLTSDPPEPAIGLNERALTDADTGPASPDDCSQDPTAMTPGCVALVGFGETATGLEDFGARKKVIVPLRSVEKRTLTAGTADQTTCRGDSGGPVFMDLGSGLQVVAVTARHNNTCYEAITRTRVDLVESDFIYPYEDRFGATCGLQGDSNMCDTSCPRTPDPDCDPCAWNDICQEDCPTRDWDCPIGIFPGAACTKDGDCERGGSCIEATDDSSFTYCTEPCDPAATRPCEANGMVCDEGGASPQCVWPEPTPGSQGFPCSTNLDCRSGICEELICVNECDPSAADPCPANVADPGTPYNCSPSRTQPGKDVCLGTIFSGGGGFCQTGGDQGPWSALVLLGLIAASLRRRRR